MNEKTKNILIRICYIIPFLLFAFAFIEEGFLMEERFRKFDFWIIAPLIVFLYQSIRNSIIGWGAAMILYLIFLYLIGNGILSSIDSLGAKIDTQTFVIQILIGLVFMGLGYLYWKIRPKKRLI
jgi:hypothetical protein